MDELLYVPATGPASTWGLLYRLDPRSKLLFVVGLTLYLAFSPEPLASLVMLAGLHLLCVGYAPTRRRLWTFWQGLWPLAATLVVLASLSWRAADPLFALGPVSVTGPSLWAAIGLAARISAVSLGFSLLLWTTQPGDVVAGLNRLGVPFTVGFPVVMALQYVATFRQMFGQIVEAQQSRGLLLAQRNPIRAARTYVPVLVPLLISALRSADSLALALASRGFGSGRRRTFRRQLRFHRIDGLFLAASGAVVLGLVVGSVFLG